MIAYLTLRATWARLAPVLVWGMIGSCCCAAPAFAAAQAVPPKASAPIAKPARGGANPASAAPGAAAAPRLAPADAAARNAVLQSQSWQDTLRRFNDWLSSQVLYDDEEVKQIRARLEVGTSRMSADDLQAFLYDLQAKLDVLESDRALDAQDYLAAKFLVASEAYARRVRQQLPDVLSMTPAQIDQRLAVFAAKRQSRAQAQQAFEQGRQQRLASNKAQLQARRQQRPATGGRATTAVTAASTPNNFTPARDFFPEKQRSTPFMAIGLW